MTVFQANKKHIFSPYAFYTICVVLTGLYSCSATKFLKENQTLYTGAEVKLEPTEKAGDKSEISDALAEFIQPKPNLTIFGSRPRLWIYFKVKEPKKEKGFKHWLKYTVGEPPLLFKDVNPERIRAQMNNEMFNMGYFDAEVKYNINKDEEDKTAYVDYVTTYSAPYTLNEINFPDDSLELSKRISGLQEKTILREGQRFDLDKLQEERQRIENGLKDQGFYFFNNDNLIFETDSTVGDKKIDLFLKVKENAPPQASKVYKIGKINVYPDYSISNQQYLKDGSPVVTDSMSVYDKNDLFRPEVLTNSILLRPGGIYSRQLHNKSLNRLVGLGTFKFVNMRFDEDTTNQTLNTSVYLTPLKGKSLRMEIQAVSKSNNFVGPGLNLTYTNRNTFHGAELFQLTLNSSFETQISGQGNAPLNSFEIGLQGSLTIPRFITPFNIRSRYRFVPQTKIGAGITLLSRVNYFRMRSFTANYGFIWKESKTTRHDFTPIDITFVQLSNQGPLFDSLIADNPFLARTYEDQFILGGKYSYTFNSKLDEKNANKDNNFYFNANIDISGNLLHLIQRSVNNTENTVDNPYNLFGYTYAQFGKFDVDFRHYYKIDKNNQIASRLILGLGIPYGNSSVLPYIKQFSAGGSNSIRAFRARSVGPGTYYNPALNSGDVFIDQTGDIKLEANLEYRFAVLGPIKGALFADAGNIWLANEDDRVGGQFDSNTFLKELAIGSGLGLRVDTDFFVLRLDVAFPIRKQVVDDLGSEEANMEPRSIPYQWVLDDIAFGQKDWRKKNLVWNIAIGYPF